MLFILDKLAEISENYYQNLKEPVLDQNTRTGQAKHYIETGHLFDWFNYNSLTVL